MSYRVAVVGATGAVGQEMLEVLERRAFPIRELRLLASERSVGRELTFRGEPACVELLCEESLRGLDVALFSAGSSISKQYAPEAASSGVLVID
ncbi:MAG: aspartate-semialdehyde dehydrogenase, partial [Planctomycetota bacterium]